MEWLGHIYYKNNYFETCERAKKLELNLFRFVQ